MNVAIAGYGAEGESNYKYYTARGDKVTIVDEAERPKYPLPDGASTRLGSGSFADLGAFDLVVRTAGLNPNKLNSAHKIWSATNEFFSQCPAPIIGVTGTKGKGTTSSLIASILREAGKNVHLVGNIGVPALDELSRINSNDVVVYELSSFQLWDLEFSPHIAVVLMIEPDHQDVHADMEEYVNAKATIRSHQTEDDLCIFHPTNEYARRIAWVPSHTPGIERGELPANAKRYAVKDDGQVYAQDGMFRVGESQICTTATLAIPGAHNVENACAAISAVLAIMPDCPFGAIAEGLNQFTGLPHRLKFVRDVAGVRYYDDSIATTPGSAIAALHAFEGGKIIILGGSDKGADYRVIVDECKSVGARVVAIGETGEKIAALCEQKAVACERLHGVMAEVVPHIQQSARAGDVVILSPASASFDQYKNYSDRGDQFVATVEGL